MAIKPLKLKRYISEEEAAQLLSLLIGEAVTSEEMGSYALDGVIPAYLKYAPKNRELHPGDCFYLVAIEHFSHLGGDHFRGVEDEGLHALDKAAVDVLSTTDAQKCFQVLPYPLLTGGYVAEATGNRWRVFVGGPGETLEKVGDSHFVRVYSPPEVCKVAQLLNDSESCPEWPAVLHSHATVAEDEFYDYQPFQWQSPFDEGLHFLIPERTTHTSPDKPPRRIINWPLVVAGLVELLQDGRRDVYKTQDAISIEISERHSDWPYASKSAINQAMSDAKKERARVES